ncbi:MAG: PQQ-binding-like beta-propeller repeat protein [Verrucomicrobiae bacterium]|nr:PQQ-binding-like beta-propeller repeat protein [Verrucomicrobiae bacterium]
MRIVVPLMSVCLLSPALLRAADWPEFRGPTGQGHAAPGKLPLQWSASKNVAWKTPVPGEGWSSPVVAGGRVFLTAAVAEGGGLSLRAFAFDEDSGRPLWSTEVFRVESAGPKHQKNSHASPTSIIEGDRVWVHFGPNGTACLDTEGKVVWRNNDFNYPPVHGNGGSPPLAGNALIFSCDGGEKPFIVALDKQTGKTLWNVPRVTEAKRTFSFSTPLVIEVDGRTEVITPGSAVVSALDPKTGRELWRVRYAEGYSVIPRPVFAHGLLYVTTGYGRPVLMAIRPGGNGDVSDTHVAWTEAKGAPHTPSLLVVGDELYMVSDAGIASCLDARTGKVHWSERLDGGFSASPLFADGRIHFQNETGTGVVIAPGRTFQKLAENVIGERTLASYAVADGALFLRGDRHLFKIAGR